MLVSHFLIDAAVLFSIIALAITPLAFRRWLGAIKVRNG